MTAGSSADLDVRLGRRVATVAATALLFVAYVLLAALPAKPFSLPGPDTKAVRGFVPQGWAFFTKSPRSMWAQVYRHQPDGGWQDITMGPLAQPRYTMGLDRAPRAQGTEVAMLLSLLPKQAWRDCERPPTACLSEAPPVGTVTNRSNRHTVCGDIGVVQQEVLPWAWRDAPTTMPSKVVRVRVTC